MSYKVVRLAHAGKRNRYLAATGIAFIGYVLFLSSALWFPGQKKSMEYTPLGIQQEIGETTCMVSVVYWAYAPEQEAMLVELDLDGIRSEVTFYAVDKARDPIPVETGSIGNICVEAFFRARGFSGNFASCDGGGADTAIIYQYRSG